MSAVLTADLIRAYLLLTKTSPEQDAVLSRLGDAVHGAIEQHTGRVLSSTAHSAEPYNGNGRSSLYLRHDPILSVQSVSIEGTSKTVSNGTTWPLSDVVYIVGESKITLTTGRVFPEGFANVLVAHTSGLSSPAPLVQAGIQWAAEIFSTGRRSLTDDNALDTAPVPSYVMGQINRYRRVIF